MLPTAKRPRGGVRRWIASAFPLALLAASTGVVVLAPPASAATTRQNIVSVAQAQLGGTACNPGYYNSCGMQWCAEFARWVWSKAGVSDVKGLDGWAQSFKTYGTDRGLYHSRSSGYDPQPGDAIVFDWDGATGDSHPIDHVALVTSATNTVVNTIGGNQDGSNMYDSKVSRTSYGRSDGNIVGYVEPAGAGSAGPTEPERPVGHSVTGDSFSDLMALKSNGDMFLYSNNFVRDKGVPYSSADGSLRQIGSGWGGYSQLIPADVTGDGFTDLVAIKSDGTMFLYSNNFSRDGGQPYSSGTGDLRQIGSGWGGFDRIMAADLSGDGFAELVARKPDGTLYMYLNNFSRDGGRPYSTATQIGSGWGGFDRLMTADVSGDGFAELVAVKPDGTMYMYLNNFARDGGRPYSTATQIGSGWNNFSTMIAADATGDGFAELLTVKSDGTMYMYLNNFARDGGRPYSSTEGNFRQIGSGWTQYNRILA